MLISQLFTNPLTFVAYLIALFVAICVHEASHAYMADRLGDPTPRLAGRITLDPRSHIDPMGLLFLLMVGFGWGRPVMFDPYNLRNPRRDSAVISLAGPGSNFLVALVVSLVVRTIVMFNLSGLAGLADFLIPVIYLNVLLGVFNFVPIAPLDGFKIVGGLLSDRQARDWYSLERYGIIFLIALLLPIGGQSMISAVILPAVGLLLRLLLPASLGMGIL